MTKETAGRYLISTAVTFFAGFAMVLIGEWNDLTLDAIRNGAAVGIVFAAVRAGIKAVLEMFLAWYARRK